MASGSSRRKQGEGERIDQERGVFMISVAAELAEMHPQTLRMYEARGLITPKRSPKNTRLYSQADVERLRRIQEMTSEEGLNLAGVETVLELERRLERMRTEIARMRKRAAEMEDRMTRELEKLRRSLGGELVPYGAYEPESLTGGAYDFIVKPVNATQLLHAAERALHHRRLVIERREHVVLLERHVAEATRELDVMLHQLEDTYRSTLEALGSAIDTRDVATQAHSRRVRGYTLMIARAHGVPEADLGDLERGVLLHDIGKIGIPDAILFKPGPLTPDEWRIMQRHPDIGRQLIEKIPFLHDAVPIVYHHHERWDGTGYPLGLRGEAIPLGARIFAVADTFDAMTFDRPYSKAVSFQRAREEIRRCAGTHFDPAVVATFLTIPVHLLVEIQRVSTEEPK